MRTSKYIFMVGLIITLLSTGAYAQGTRQRRAPSQGSRAGQASESSLTGLYRIDTAGSDTLYSVVADASTNLPFREQQRFFIDLAVRLTPPDQFSIEQRGRNISIASSRAPRINFEADGVAHTERASDGHTVRTQAVLARDRLSVNTSGASDDSFSVSFELIEGGRKLRVVRRINAKELNEPVVIRSVYDRVSEVAHWGIYGEPEVESTAGAVVTAGAGRRPLPSMSGSNVDAAALSRALERWVAATNGKDLRSHLSFYMPKLKAFYLARNVSREAVKMERARAFEGADLISVRALTPETIIVDDGRVAIMRFRKQYVTEKGSHSRRGEVIQELRWQRTEQGWKIFSERDIRVLR
jgi:ketosteroid isomerase-like protein